MTGQSRGYGFVRFSGPGSAGLLVMQAQKVDPPPLPCTRPTYPGRDGEAKDKLLEVGGWEITKQEGSNTAGQDLYLAWTFGHRVTCRLTISSSVENIQVHRRALCLNTLPPYLH